MDSAFDNKTPGDVIREKLNERGWTQADLADVIGKPLPAVNEVIQGRRSITPDMASALAIALGIDAVEWIRMDAAQRLSGIKPDSGLIERKSRIRQLAPIREMQRRGWLKDTADLTELEKELKTFFEVDSLELPLQFPIAMRKGEALCPLNRRQLAWCFRAKQLAKTIPIGKYEEKNMRPLKRELRFLAAYPAEARHVPALMRDNGIRFVVVEHLSGSKVDGAAFWFDEQSPAIAVSLRLDRIDNFWFTLMHECAHIEHYDAISVDTEMGHEEREQPLMKETIEKLADENAATTLVPLEELNSFIRRIGPIYAKPNIIQFAHRIKMHPGIIVGQLQHRGEIKFGHHNDMQPKIRAHVISTALTDGWGMEMAPGSI
ncbi:MAG: helix-turn-helix domain-containing protein [Sedimentisphaerales bacterium]